MGKSGSAMMAAMIGALFLCGGAVSQTADKAAELAFPDVETWPTIGSTMRMDKEHGTLPWQFRQVQIEPGAFAGFVETGKFADGAAFAAVFYSVKLDGTHTPPLYHADQQVGSALEVIDRAHPDGRRFYVFTGGAARVAPLPAGNACAACHNARGGFDGTFAQYYPLLSRRLKPSN